MSIPYTHTLCCENEEGRGKGRGKGKGDGRGDRDRDRDVDGDFGRPKEEKRKTEGTAAKNGKRDARGRYCRELEGERKREREPRARARAQQGKESASGQEFFKKERSSVGSGSSVTCSCETAPVRLVQDGSREEKEDGMTAARMQGKDSTGCDDHGRASASLWSGSTSGPEMDAV